MITMTIYECRTCGNRFNYEPTHCPVCGSGRISPVVDYAQVQDTAKKLLILMIVVVIFIILVIYLILHFIFHIV